MGENIVDVGVSFPGNGARKLVDGSVMMVPENLMAFVDEVKRPASWRTPREGFDEYSSKFSLS
jgi:hypothetical protein